MFHGNEQDRLIQGIVSEITDGVTQALVREVHDFVTPNDGTSPQSSYLSAIRQLIRTINAPTGSNHNDYHRIQASVKKSVHMAINEMANKPIMPDGSVEQIKILITENVMNAFKNLSDNDLVEDPDPTKVFGPQEASNLIKNRVSVVLQLNPQGIEDRIKKNLAELLNDNRPLPPKPTGSDSSLQKKWEEDCQKVNTHNKYASDMKSIWQKKFEDKKKLEEDNAAAAQSTAGAPKKKTEDNDQGPRPTAHNAGGAKQESLPEQLWNRAMYEDKTILMALVLDIFLLLPIMCISFLGRASQYGWRHAALMTAGLEALTEADPALDVFIRHQIFGQHETSEPENSHDAQDSSAGVNKDKLLNSGLLNAPRVVKPQ